MDSDTLIATLNGDTLSAVTHVPNGLEKKSIVYNTRNTQEMQLWTQQWLLGWL